VTIPVNVVVAMFAAVSARASEPATEDAIDRRSAVEGVVVERQVGDGFPRHHQPRRALRLGRNGVVRLQQMGVFGLRLCVEPMWVADVDHLRVVFGRLIGDLRALG
jgi:hypothetical protein